MCTTLYILRHPVLKLSPVKPILVLTYTDILDNNYVSCMIHEYWDSLKRDNIDLTDSNVAC